jgi:integrase
LGPRESVPLIRTQTPGVYRKGARYMVRYRVRGEERKRSVRTYAEARSLKAKLTTDVQSGEHRELQRVTFEHYAREWIDTYSGRTTRGFRESTRVGYRRTIEVVAIPFFAKRTKLLTELEPRDIRAFVAWLFDEEKQGRQLAVGTVRQHMAAVRAMLATATEDGLIRHNPAAGVRISRPGTPAMAVGSEQLRRALDTDELTRFLAACAPEWRVFFELLAMTGVRISEALELRWEDVDFGAKRLRVRRQCFKGVVAEPKSRHGKRDIPLSTAMARQLWKLQGAPDDLMFTGSRGERIERDWLWRNMLKPAAKTAAVPWVGFHTFRHTCASILFANGRNPKIVQMWLGHSDPGFTLRTYVHLIDDGMGDADFLDEAVRATSEGHMRATRGTETQANAETALVAKLAS